MTAKRKVPAAVLSRAKAASEAHAPQKPVPPKPPPAPARPPSREKVIRALKRLHPMD